MDNTEEIELGWILLIGTAITFALALSIVLFLIMYQRRMAAQQRAMDLLKIEEQEKRLEAVLAVQEDERSRIALDLHDEVGALLSTVKLYMSNKNLKPEYQEKATNMLDDAVTKLRGISRNLSPENLQMFGLISTLEQQIHYLEEIHPLKIHLNHNLEDERLPPEVEIQFYRILQELLNNTIKHAQAQNVSINLTLQATKAEAEYKDDGVGFDMEKANQGKSLGLTSLASRIQILKGEYQVESFPNEGVRVKIDVPLTQIQEPLDE